MVSSCRRRRGIFFGETTLSVLSSSERYFYRKIQKSYFELQTEPQALDETTRKPMYEFESRNSY
jgi:hypothetical protein